MKIDQHLVLGSVLCLKVTRVGPRRGSEGTGRAADVRGVAAVERLDRQREFWGKMTGRCANRRVTTAVENGDLSRKSRSIEGKFELKDSVNTMGQAQLVAAEVTRVARESAGWPPRGNRSKGARARGKICDSVNQAGNLPDRAQHCRGTTAVAMAISRKDQVDVAAKLKLKNHKTRG